MRQEKVHNFVNFLLVCGRIARCGVGRGSSLLRSFGPACVTFMPDSSSHHPSDLGERLRAARLGAGLTQEQLAGLIGCSKSQLSQMEAGLRTISQERAAAIEEALGVTDGSLVQAVRWSRAPAELRDRLRESEERERRLAGRLRQALDAGDPVAALRRLVEQNQGNMEDPLPLGRSIPVINSIAAGLPTEFTDLDYPASVADEYIACPEIADPEAFAARVVGDSMEPAYREGEIVVFSPMLPVESGRDCFVRLERDQETTFKRVFIEDDGRTIRLEPLNPAYAARRVDREEVAGLYAAAYVMRRV